MHINTKATKNSQGQLKTDESSSPYLCFGEQLNKQVRTKDTTAPGARAELKHEDPD